MGYCDGNCDMLNTRYHKCDKYNKRLTYMKQSGRCSIGFCAHEQCKECEKDQYIEVLSTENKTLKQELESIHMKTGLFDKTGKEIKVGDTTRLKLDDGEIRDFAVEFKTVKRTVKSHPDFDDKFATVNITGIVFCWEGYDLFPCVDENGISDVSKMEIIPEEALKDKEQVN